MALRRVLPSRATPEKAPDGAATAAPVVAESPREPAPRTSSPAEASSVKPVTPPENIPAQAQTGAVAAAATSAFSTLPGTPARVLEDSFVKPAVTTLPEVKPEAVPAFSAPAWEAETKARAEEESAAATARAVREAMPIPEPEAPAAPVKAAWQAPASYASQESSVPPLAEATQSQIPVASFELPAAPLQPVPLASQPEAKPELNPEPKPEAKPQPVPAAAPAAVSLEQQPSRPDNSPHKRRVREKRPRDFSAMGAAPADPDQPSSNKPVTSFAANVPVDTRPLDKVNDALIATGVMAPKPLDSLTGNLPTGLAETSFTPQPAAVELPEIKPAPAPKPAPVAAPVVAPAAPVPAPKAAEPLPIIQPAPERAPQPLPVIEPAMPPISTTPTFNLSSNTPAPVADALPPPQSDLPWTRTQSAAEWEIETPDTGHWQPEGGEGASPSMPAAAHMPPPTADLYKPFGNASQQGGNTMSGIPPRSSTHFTPELPGQRSRSGGGTPWVLIAVIVLAAGGAGAYFLTSGGNGKVQQQLATLTNGSTKPSAASGNNALLPPPDNSPFYTPPAVANATPSTDTSSSAVVVFADVPADQANQPIVATGKEEVPKDLNVFDRFKTEVQRIKAGDDNGTAATPAAAQPAATATGAITPDKLQEELAAYRSALAQSGDPKSLTPSTFRKDPDGYMDGKPQQAQGTPTSTDANGALLPPPAGNAGVLPPPDLYTNNPKNLPVVNEPLANAPARVRTLADFPDIEPYTPEREKVEIPKNLKPKMAATDFPALEVLSFVPGKGIVAFADGREGVLLIGESLNGWELVAVTPDNAQFKAGQKSYQVSAEN